MTYLQRSLRGNIPADPFHQPANGPSPPAARPPASRSKKGRIRPADSHRRRQASDGSGRPDTDKSNPTVGGCARPGLPLSASRRTV